MIDNVIYLGLNHLKLNKKGPKMLNYALHFTGSVACIFKDKILFPRTVCQMLFAVESEAIISASPQLPYFTITN